MRLHYTPDQKAGDKLPNYPITRIVSCKIKLLSHHLKKDARRMTIVKVRRAVRRASLKNAEATNISQLFWLQGATLLIQFD